MSTQPITVTDAAKLLGKHVSGVRSVCSLLGIGHCPNSRLRLLSAADVRRLKKIFSGRKVGRPRKS